MTYKVSCGHDILAMVAEPENTHGAAATRIISMMPGRLTSHLGCNFFPKAKQKRCDRLVLDMSFGREEGYEA